MAAKASIKHLRITPRKMRVVCNEIRGSMFFKICFGGSVITAGVALAGAQAERFVSVNFIAYPACLVRGSMTAAVKQREFVEAQECLFGTVCFYIRTERFLVVKDFCCIFGN